MVSVWRERFFAHYFFFAMAAFWVAHLLLPTIKAVNNVFYALVALPALAMMFTRVSHFNLASLRGPLSILLCWLIYAGLRSGWDADWRGLKHVLYIALLYGTIIFLVEPTWWRSVNLFRASFWLLALYVLASCIYLWLTGAYPFGVQVVWLPARMNGPIFTSMCLVALWVAAVVGWIERHQWLELLVASALVLFLMLAGLQSRSGIVGWFVLTAFLSLWWNWRKALVIWAILLMVLVSVLWQELKPLIENSSLIVRADSHRFELWAKVWQELKVCGPVFGCGPEYQISSELLATPGVSIAHPHNIYLSEALYRGIPSALLFAGLMLWSLLCSWRENKAWCFYLLGAACMLNLDGNSLIGNPDELWLLVHWPMAAIIALHLGRSVQSA